MVGLVYKYLQDSWVIHVCTRKSTMLFTAALTWPFKPGNNIDQGCQLGYKLAHISHKWDKSGTFYISLKYTENWFKKSQICPTWG